MKQTAKSILIRSACALTLGFAGMAAPDYAPAQISVAITLAPPALPVYEQPILVEEGSIWAPGYWDYDQGGYFWVPGAWVQPPTVGFLWTPGYWGWGNGGYAWNAGYWGPTVGFYGGINYGFGYFGHGYEGGHWQGQRFYYNTAVSRVNVANIHSTYVQTVNNAPASRVSFNGGNGGVASRPTGPELAAASAAHQPATAAQTQNRQAAMAKPVRAAAVDHGRPATVAPARPAGPPAHAADLPAIVHQPVPSTGDAARDKVNQQQQDKLRDNQEKQRQALQQQQAADHARAAQATSRNAGGEELERQHQAQTQALVQRHASEQQSLRETQAKRPGAEREAGRD